MRREVGTPRFTTEEDVSPKPKEVPPPVPQQTAEVDARVYHADKSDIEVLDSPYHIDKKIGSGGFGVVYLVREKKYSHRLDTEYAGAEVVLKVLNPVFFDNKEAMEIFKKELDAHVRFGKNNPYIVPIIDHVRVRDVLTDRESMGIVMQYMPDGSMRDVSMRQHDLTGRAALPEQTIAVLGIELARALYTIHKDGFIHGDLKPDNVFVDLEAATVKLGDFGIAQSIEMAKKEIAKNGKLQGTPPYISPEILRRKDVSSGRDLYALGIMLYEWRTGMYPFYHEYEKSPTKGFEAQVSDHPPSIRETCGEGKYVYSFLDPLIETLIARDPKKRRRFKDVDGEVFEIDSAMHVIQTIQRLAQKNKLSLHTDHLADLRALVNSGERESGIGYVDTVVDPDAGAPDQLAA